MEEPAAAVALHHMGSGSLYGRDHPSCVLRQPCASASVAQQRESNQDLSSGALPPSPSRFVFAYPSVPERQNRAVRGGSPSHARCYPRRGAGHCGWHHARYQGRPRTFCYSPDALGQFHDRSASALGDDPKQPQMAAEETMAAYGTGVQSAYPNKPFHHWGVRRRGKPRVRACVG